VNVLLASELGHLISASENVCVRTVNVLLAPEFGHLFSNLANVVCIGECPKAIVHIVPVV